MRFHVVSLPHTHTTKAFQTCAYTEKVRKFCNMMMDRGHQVYLYAGEQNEAQCTEHIACIDEETRKAVVGDRHYVEASFDYTLPHWINFNQRCIDEIKIRAHQKDFLCIIAGYANKLIADAMPHITCVEFGIGYGGSFSKYRVWESYAWMHTCYGAQSQNNPHGVDGQAFDEVIPNYLDIRDFPFEYHKQGYYAYMGRFTERKGFGIAVEVAKRTGIELRMAGPEHGFNLTPASYVGELDCEARGKFLSKARALFVPTQYIEPFGTVAIEAMMCGTPVITSDWGAFTETVRNDINGVRCRTLQDYINAVKRIEYLNPSTIRKQAVEKYSLKVIGKRYEQYFERLMTLWDEGWYKLEEAA